VPTIEIAKQPFSNTMSNSKYIVFDFDGTLVNTIDMALKIYDQIASDFNLKPAKHEDKELLRSKRPQELLKIYGITTSKLMLLLLRIRKELTKHLPEMDLVVNMETALRAMKNEGYRLGVLTSNSKANVSMFLKNKGLLELFEFIYSGNNIFGKEHVIRRMLKQENIDKDNIIYVGDETRDIEASKKAGIPIISVSWGLNHRDTLSALHPDHIADDPDELLEIIHQ
jgi:phosphoglycolate phosphatase-like HAD superfamily hydrolase